MDDFTLVESPKPTQLVLDMARQRTVDTDTRFTKAQLFDQTLGYFVRYDPTTDRFSGMYALYLDPATQTKRLQITRLQVITLHAAAHPQWSPHLADLTLPKYRRHRTVDDLDDIEDGCFVAWPAGHEAGDHDVLYFQMGDQTITDVQSTARFTGPHLVPEQPSSTYAVTRTPSAKQFDGTLAGIQGIAPWANQGIDGCLTEEASDALRNADRDLSNEPKVSYTIRDDQTFAHNVLVIDECMGPRPCLPGQWIRMDAYGNCTVHDTETDD